LTTFSAASISSREKATPVGALGEVRKNARAGEAAICASGRRIERSNAMVCARPSWIATSTGYSE
jgi:hypothetical protein